MKFIIFYAPTAIEIIKPAKITFDAFELQEGILDLSEFLQKASNEMLKLMNRQELEQFHSKLYKKAQKT